MKRSTIGRDFLIGFVFLGALAVFGYGTLKAVSLNLLGLSKDVQVPFDEIAGLRVGDDVKFYGLKVGVVTKIVPRFDAPQQKLLVHCRFDSDVQLPGDSEFLVRSSGPLGGRYVEIIPGSQASVTIDDGTFSGRSEQDLFDGIAELVDEIREGNGLLHQLIHEDSVGEDFAAIMREIREVVQSINAAEGVLGALIKNQDWRDRTDALISDVGSTFRDIREGEGTIPMLIRDSETRDSVRNALSNIEEISRKIREGEGTVGRLVADDSIARDLEEFMSSAKTFMKDLEEGKGALAMLATDEAFKKDLQDAVSAAKDSLSSISEGEGTLGQLIKNREAYDQLMRTLDNVGDAVEDFREQAPISTFVNAIFTGL